MCMCACVHIYIKSWAWGADNNHVHNVGFSNKVKRAWISDLCTDTVMSEPIKEVGVTFGKRLSRLMDEKGLKLRQAADIAEIGVSTLHGWVEDRAPTNFQAVRRLAQALEVSMAYLLTGEDDHPHTAPTRLEDTLRAKEVIFDGTVEVLVKRLIPKEEE